MAAILTLGTLPRGVRVRPRSWLLAAVLVAPAACGDPIRLEVFPSRVQVDITTTPLVFRAAAHLRGKRGELLSDPIDWTPSGSEISWTATGDHNIILVKVHPSARTDQPVRLTATAQNGKYRAEIALSFVRSDALTTDRALANHRDEGFPSVALVGGSLGGCVRDTIFPFVQAGELGDWTADTCDPPLRPAVVFAEDRAPLLKDPWDHPAPPPVYDELNAVIVTLPDTDPNPPPTPPSLP